MIDLEVLRPIMYTFAISGKSAEFNLEIGYNNGGVPRHLAMSIGYDFSYPDAISKMIKDEQIKVEGC